MCVCQDQHSIIHAPAHFQLCCGQPKRFFCLSCMAWLQRESLKRSASAAAGPLSTPTKEPRDQIAVDITPPPQPHVKRIRREKRAQRKRIAARTFHNGSAVHDYMRDASVDLKSSSLSSTSIHHAYITCCSASEAIQ